MYLSDVLFFRVLMDAWPAFRSGFYKEGYCEHSCMGSCVDIYFSSLGNIPEWDYWDMAPAASEL